MLLPQEVKTGKFGVVIINHNRTLQANEMSSLMKFDSQFSKPYPIADFYD